MIRRVGSILLFAAMVCASVTWAGCGRRQVRTREEVLVVLFDTSGSTQVARDKYLQDFRKALDEYRDHKNRLIILGDVITDNTLATAEYRIDACVEEDKGWLGNPMKRNMERNKAVAQAKDALKLVFPHSDIMTGLQLAEKVFAGHRNAVDKRLIIFSDMIEQSSRYNFYSEKFTPDRIRQIINKEREDLRLPCLPGVKVWCAGVGVARKPGLSSTQMRRFQEFWMEYLRACKAEADPSHYAARLINFD